ncbi:MAG TPA: hypothetical protein VG929_09375 [Actinomycetota bacterium]|nr:hypothetical protein [Actinomycetota bacterium]
MTFEEQLDSLGHQLADARRSAGAGDARGTAHALRNLATNATLLATVVALRPAIRVRDTLRRRAG